MKKDLMKIGIALSVIVSALGASCASCGPSEDEVRLSCQTKCRPWAPAVEHAVCYCNQTLRVPHE